jgi:hypothetical protein
MYAFKYFIYAFVSIFQSTLYTSKDLPGTFAFYDFFLSLPTGFEWTCIYLAYNFSPGTQDPFMPKF